MDTTAATSTIAPTPAAHAPEIDPLSAFVASLTPEQKAKLAALLLGGKPPG